ncbi:MAG: hypothetical protein Ta2B_01110 [Termitinemataceae bacterium]|nr:MAG: hypothetical protein Ta2B_01110 [Termitinemataceae bacterium]
MKGVIVQVGNPKSIALFNNGKIGAVPTPSDCHVGMVIDISYNRKKIILLCVFVFSALLGILLGGRFLYFSPIGYVQIVYGLQRNKTISLELSYNYFERVISAKPLNTFSVTPIMDMHIKKKSINDAYTTILEKMDIPKMGRERNYINVRIAQDNLEKAKKIEQGFKSLSGNSVNLNKRNITYELCTLELYQKLHQNMMPNMFTLPQRHVSGEHLEHRNGRRN